MTLPCRSLFPFCVFPILLWFGSAWGETVECTGPVIINEFVSVAASKASETLEWTTSSYDDSTWLKGVGGIGYGDGDDATVVNIQNKAKSIYLRTLFNATLPEAGIAFPNGGFEEGSFTGWTVTGSAWKITSAANGVGHTGFNGTYYADSIRGGETTTGTLRSPVFTLTEERVEFLIAGHSYWPGVESENDHNYVTLCRASNGTEIDRLYTPGQDSFTTVFLDGSQAVGEQVYLLVVDNGTNTGYAWLAVDQFRMVSGPTPPVEDFESGGFTEGGWTTTGSAWRVIIAGQGFSDSPVDGIYAAASNYTGSSSTDALAGTLTSQPITVPEYAVSLNFAIAGHDGYPPGGAGEVYLNVLKSDKTTVIAQVAPPSSNSWSFKEVDVTAFRGQQIILKAVDARSDSYGWMAIDAFQFYPTAPSSATETLKIKVDYDDGFVAYLNGKEIARRNLGSVGSDVAYNQLANSGHEAGTPETILIGAAADYLLDGTNVLAIEIHNDSLTSTDLSLIADLFIATESPNYLVRHEDSWNYFIGTHSPNTNTPLLDKDGEASDWIELLNTGTETVSLEGWSLTDSDSTPAKWVFPAVSLNPGAFLVIFASGKDLNDPTSNLHTIFKLEKEGEYLALYDNAEPRQRVCGFLPEYPSQVCGYSYGRTNEGGDYTYLSPPTPGAENTPTESFTRITPAPEFSIGQRFISSATTVSLSCSVTDVTLTYTLDGTKPTLSNGIPYNNPIPLTQTRVIRACAFHEGWIPSEVVTQTFLYKQATALKTLPALSIVGDEQGSLYEPDGVMAIVGGTYNDTWQAVSATDYNNPIQRGNDYERPISASLIYPNGTDGFSAECGIRVAGSDFARYRYQRTEDWLEWQEKFSFRLYFRGEYGPSELEYPLVPLADRDAYDCLWLRAGHNDHQNPFIRDELARRLFHDCGQKGPLGTFANLYINGDFKGYYNLVERLDEDFFNFHYGTNSEWDIVHIGELQSGTLDAWNKMFSFASSNNMSNYANYQKLAGMLDLTNFVDYLIVNFYANTWDWPQNNWVAARECVDGGLFRFYLWDAEGAFGNGNAVNYDIISWVYSSGSPIDTLLTSLMNSAEFRLFFADRVQQHFNNGGAMMDTRLYARFDELRAAVIPMVLYVYGSSYDSSIRTTWIPQRRTLFFKELTNYNLWPSILPPTTNLSAGEVTAGATITLTNPSRLGQILFTLDGTEPRIPVTGLPSPSVQVYSTPIPVTQTLVLKARVKSNSVWSPLLEIQYTVEPPKSGDILISEFLANAVGDDESKEWFEVFNTTDHEIDLAGWTISDNGTDLHTIPSSLSVIVPSKEHLVLGRSSDTSVNGGAPVNYAYGDEITLGNSADELILKHEGMVIASLGYGDYETGPVPIVVPVDYDPTAGYALGLAADYCESATQPWAMQSSIYGTGSDTGTPGKANDGVTLCPAIDKTAPQLLGARFTQRDQILLQYNEPLDASSVTSMSQFTVSPFESHPIQVSLYSSNRLLLEFTAPLPASVSCVVTAVSVKDAAGNGAGVIEQATTSYQMPDISITEVMYNNRGTDIEWVEILNTTDHTLDLSGWILTDGASYPVDASDEGSITLPAGTLLNAGERAVINLWNAENFSLWGFPPEIRVLSPTVLHAGALSNGGDNLALFNATSGGVLIDGSLTVPSPDLCSDGESLEKIDEYFPWGDTETVSLNFRAAEVSIGFTTGSSDGTMPLSDQASPGRENGTEYPSGILIWELY